MTTDKLFRGSSELAQRLRALDWQRTPLGEPERWPGNLKVAIDICLASRFPMNVWWGASLTLFYNDAYVSFLGPGKHPAVLGRSGREAWAEIWDVIGPMIDAAMTTGEASWSEDIEMFFDRDVPCEEVYVTFSFSPIHAQDGGGIDGLFCACTETTEKLVGSRRVETLRRLSLRAVEAQSPSAACSRAARVLDSNPRDVPFSAIYLIDEAERVARLSAVSRLPVDHPLPSVVPLDAVCAFRSSDRWHIAEVAATQRPAEVEISDLELPGGPWPEPATKACVLPIPGATHGSLGGVLIVGASTRRLFDAQYGAFFELVAGHVGSALADARAHEEERRRAEALAELDRAKTAFFSNVSHELRTPLTLILGPVEEALSALDSTSLPAIGPPLEIVRRNAMRMLKLVNALLDFSRLEAGRVQALFEPADLATVTAEIASTFRSVIESAGLGFELECESLPEPIWVDRGMWDKIVLNLLSNAFKFTLRGRIQVSLRATGDTHVALVVTDTGTGIASEQLPHVFERFHRIEGARGRTHDGSGIGLALVQELTRMHGGTVSVESRVGSGTSFTVTLRRGSRHLPAERLARNATRESAPPPIESSTSDAFVAEAQRWLATPIDLSGSRGAPATPRRTEARETAGARVLVVDDNADLRAYLVAILSPRWSVETAGDGLEALELLRRERFELVLSDVMMPGLNGLGLLREVRLDRELRSLPVILLSARAGEESRIDGLGAGADDYLVKPFSAREAVARVEAQLRLARRTRELEERRAKDELLAVLSHELRTPLSPILLWSRALQQGKVRASEIGRAVGAITASAERQLRLIDDLLDLARMNTAQLSLRRTWSDVGVLARAAATMVTPSAEERRIEVVVDAPASVGPACIDPERIEQVFWNLLGNAVKFSAPGGRVSLTLRDAGDDVVASIADTGTGIPAELEPSLFEPFSQASRGEARAHQGLGIGLSISRQLVLLHGGTLEARNEEHGAVFTVRLPKTSASLEQLA